MKCSSKGKGCKSHTLKTTMRGTVPRKAYRVGTKRLTICLRPKLKKRSPSGLRLMVEKLKLSTRLCSLQTASRPGNLVSRSIKMTPLRLLTSSLAACLLAATLTKSRRSQGRATSSAAPLTKTTSVAFARELAAFKSG